MAQGCGNRLPQHFPKQLIAFEGEPILARTLRQLAAICAPDVFVVGWPELDGVVGSAGAKLITQPEPGFSILEGLQNTRELWVPDDRVVMLLGDVAWSDSSLEAVLSDDRELVFAGTSVLEGGSGELYALSSDPGVHRGILWMALKGVHRRATTYQAGMLRNLLWAVMPYLALPPRHCGHRWNPTIYLPVDDWTMDVDDEDDLESLRELEARSERPL